MSPCNILKQYNGGIKKEKIPKIVADQHLLRCRTHFAQTNCRLILPVTLILLKHIFLASVPDFFSLSPTILCAVGLFKYLRPSYFVILYGSVKYLFLPMFTFKSDWIGVKKRFVNLNLAMSDL